MNNIIDEALMALVDTMERGERLAYEHKAEWVGLFQEAHSHLNTVSNEILRLRLALENATMASKKEANRIHELGKELNEMKDDRDSWIEQCGESREWELYHADRVKALENVIKMIEMKPYHAEEIIGALIPKIK